VRRTLRAPLLAGTIACLLPGIAAASSTPPSKDPFYTPPVTYADAAPGAVLATRQAAVSFAGSPATVQATQILYRTTDQLGKPSATVATLMRPAIPTPVVRLVSYQTAYNGVADTCRPSYALQEGNSAANSVVSIQSAVMLSYLAQGYTVVTSDFQGPTDAYGAGREEGYATLDGIRAALRVLAAGAKTPVALGGYSGGSIATLWAAQQAPSHARELNLVAASGGGVPAHFAHTLSHIEKGSGWTGAIPAVGMGRAYRLDLSRLLNDRGKEIMRETEKGCIVNAARPGLKLADMLKPEYRDWHHVPELALIMNDAIMGRGGTPRTPLLLGVGDQGDGSDGVMIAGDIRQLAHDYCSRGASVQFHVYDRLDHTTAFPRFATDEAAFFQQAFAGLAPSECPIAPGNPLDPLPTPPLPPQFTSGITLTPGPGNVTVGAPTSTLSNLSITISSCGPETPPHTVKLGDLPSFAERSVALPATLAPGACHRITATGSMQTAPIRATITVNRG
jgi:pimeloyl-ACP methyl ester carboxylesterase